VAVATRNHKPDHNVIWWSDPGMATQLAPHGATQPRTLVAPKCLLVENSAVYKWTLWPPPCWDMLVVLVC
jgi:hypothetical protein